MTTYYRLSGGGNDFLAFAEPGEPFEAERIRALCARGLSLGSDGLFVLRRTDAGTRMDYFNADGNAAALCLNGTRCAARLAFEMGWAEDETEILTGAGAVRATRGEGETVLTEVPKPASPAALDVPVEDSVWSGHYVEVGVPHFVLVWPESLAQAPVRQLGAALRSAPEVGSDGANVDFVRFPARDAIEVRSFERGVEGETLACGTGVLAAAAVGVLLGESDFPVEVLTQGGFRLRVDGGVGDVADVADAGDAGSTAWTLAGDARIVATGDLAPGAEALPPLPDWSA